MTRKITYLLFSLVTFFSCVQNNKTESHFLEQSKSNKIDSLANRYLELNRFSGTIAIAKNGEILYNQHFGLADYTNKVPFSSKTAFKIGEVSEIVTDDILGNLLEIGKIKLNASLSKHLDSVPADMTLGDLIKGNKTINSNIKGKLIEQVTKKSYQENIEEYATELNLENTYFNKTDSEIAVGYLYHNYRGTGLELQESPSYNLEEAFSSKGLKSTASDLVKIAYHKQDDLKLDGYLEDDGFSYSIVNDAVNTITIVVLSNRRHPVANEISSGIKAILDGVDYRLPLLRKPYAINKDILKEYSGSYSLNENVSFEIQTSNDSLYVLMGPNKVYLVPQSSNQFYMEQMDASMKFLRDSTDVVDRILLLDGFIDSDQVAYRKK